MSVLEWVITIEGIFLAIAGLAGGIAMVAGREDPVYIFFATFWRNLVWPPIPMEIDGDWAATKKPRAPAAAAAARPRLGKKLTPDTDGDEDEDAKYGRVPRDRDGRIASAVLPILVIPNSPADEVVGHEDGGLKINVTGEAGDGRTNKSLIELVSSALGVKPYQVNITKGHYHAQKAVQIQGLKPDELKSKLASL